MSETHRILLSVKGHPYERQAFYDIFDNMDNLDWTLVEQPASQALFNVKQAEVYDALVLYDMPGFFSMKMRIQILYLPLRPIKGTSNSLSMQDTVLFLHMRLPVGKTGRRIARLLAGDFSICPANYAARCAKIADIAMT